MSEVERHPESESKYEEHLHRSETVWSRWSDWYGMSEQNFEPIREELLVALPIDEGDSVLDIGCGPGVNFRPTGRPSEKGSTGGD